MLITCTIDSFIDIKVHAKIAQCNADCHVQNQSPAQLIHQKLTQFFGSRPEKSDLAGFKPRFS